jgi:two-component system chemotaxis response regulator CheB
VDCIAKPANLANSNEVFAELTLRVKSAARSTVRPRSNSAPSPRRTGYRTNGAVVAIGSSTGGVEALLQIISRFPETCPATVLTQHMPATFTKSFAARLDRSCGAAVEEAYDGAVLEPGRIFLAPGGATHLEVVRSGGALRCRLREGDPVSGHRPSVDVLFKSVAEATGAAAMGVILTGMGRDGAQGLLTMRQAGARTLGQDESTCVVYGMPRAAHEIGAVERQLPLSALGEAILDQCANLH